MPPRTRLVQRTLIILALVVSGGIHVVAAPPVIQFPDTLVIDQNGVSHQFYTDLVKDKIVVVNFVFTRCGMVCPMLGYNFGLLRKRLGSRAGTEVYLISISTDAAYDTPERLKAWARNFNAGLGWTQLTGDKQHIDGLLKSLKAFSADKQDHSTLVLVGNDRSGDWQWLDGTSNPQAILEALAMEQKDRP